MVVAAAAVVVSHTQKMYWAGSPASTVAAVLFVVVVVAVVLFVVRFVVVVVVGVTVEVMAGTERLCPCVRTDVMQMLRNERNDCLGHKTT